MAHRAVRDGPANPAGQDDDILFYVLGADGAPVAADQDDDDATFLELVGRLTSAFLADGAIHTREHDSPNSGGNLPVADSDRAGGCREDIQVTLHDDPRRACALVAMPELFDPPIRHLRLEDAQPRVIGTEVSWRVRLRTSPFRRRRATLRLAPSPSFNVTVLRLVPLRRQRISTGQFVRRGLRASNELLARIHTRL